MVKTPGLREGSHFPIFSASLTSYFIYIYPRFPFCFVCSILVSTFRLRKKAEEKAFRQKSFHFSVADEWNSLQTTFKLSLPSLHMFQQKLQRIPVDFCALTPSLALLLLLFILQVIKTDISESIQFCGGDVKP